MPRLRGVDVPGKKHARFALRYIHGIGPKRADDVLAACKVDPSKVSVWPINDWLKDDYFAEKFVIEIRK